MTPRSTLFRDFHLRGASAPEWNQRYVQMSPGVMRSSLLEWTDSGAHVFGKWMSERVVQQGGLPRGQVCFALLGGLPSQAMRAQGRDFGPGNLLVLHGGDDFEFHRPAGVELLSVSFDAAAFHEQLASTRTRLRPALLPAQAQGLLHLPAPALARLRRLIRLRLGGDATFGAGALMHAVADLLVGASPAAAQKTSSARAAQVVKACQALAQARAREQPPDIEELCRQAGTSRRSLQDSFRRVAGTTPLAYLRNLRLHAVRERLLSSRAGQVTVTQAAGEAGFDHLGRFAGDYRTLFGEVPSRTPRLGVAPGARMPRSRPLAGS